jgi:hypothetical protein
MAILACVMGALGVVESSGAAKPKFVPDVTVYHGTYSYTWGKREVEASVVDNENNHKLTVGFNVFLPATCNGEEESLPIRTEATLKGKAINFHGKIPAAGEVPGNNVYVTAAIKGHFTSTKSFTVTLRASTSVEPGNPEPTLACTAAPVTVRMKEGPAPL